MNHWAKLIERLIDDLTLLLEPHRFRRDQVEDRSSSKWEERIWIRKYIWKSEYFRFLYSVNNLGAHVQIATQVCVDVPDHGRDDSWVDGLGFLYETLPSRPYLFLFGGRYRRKIQRRARGMVPWFDQYSTPAQCLSALNEGRTNWGNTKGPIVLALERQLKELIEAEQHDTS